MADEERDRGGATTGVDSISGLPDVILQTILSSLPTKFAIRTSILSKRWRHVWCETPCLNFEWCGKDMSADSINETLGHYKARKMTSFDLCLSLPETFDYIETWIEFAKSRNVENMNLNLGSESYGWFTMPDSFYINASLKKLTLYLGPQGKIIPNSSVSWTSLKELVLRCRKLTDGSTLPKILSGCPVLESLTLDMCRCYNFNVLDLSKSLRLTRLEIATDYWGSRQLDIVAPHIRSLSLTVHHHWPCNLVDVSSLTHARLDIGYYDNLAFHVRFLEYFLRNVIDKLQNVDKLTFGENFIKVFSLAEFRRVPLPLLKFKALTFETMVSQYVIPGIVKLLQSSSELKKLTIHIKDGHCIPDEYYDCYLYSHGLKTDEIWSSEARVFKNITRNNVKSTHMAFFMELVLKSSKTLENMVVRFGSYLEMVPLLAHNNNKVSIVVG